MKMFFFKYNNKFYQQLAGLPMCGVLSVVLSGIRMNRLQRDIINATNVRPRLLMKCVGQKIRFLDIFIRNDYGNLGTIWTRNENGSKHILNCPYNHLKHAMLNILNNYIFIANNHMDFIYLSCVKKSIFESNLYIYPAI